MFIAQSTQAGEEAVGGWDTTHVAGDGFDDDRRYVPAGEVVLDQLEVVVFGDERVGDGPVRHSGARRNAEGSEPAAGGDEERVGVTVVGPGELDDPGATGRGPGETHRRRGRFGAAVDHADDVDGGCHLDDLLREFHFGDRGDAERRAVGGGALDGFDDRRVGVPEQQRSP